MHLIPITNACTLIALSYMALKLKNMLLLERYEALSASVWSGMASIVLMLSPVSGEMLLTDFRFAPLVMAGLRFGWKVALPASILPALYIYSFEDAAPYMEILQSFLLPAAVSSFYHRKEHQQFYPMISFTDGIKVCLILSVSRIAFGGYVHQEPSLHWLAAHSLLLLLSVIAVIILILMYNDDNRIWTLRRRLELQANQDSLTGLPNLRSFMNMARHTSLFRPVTIFMIDIDDFKKYNDTYGHVQGDTLLRDVGQVLGSMIEVQDYLARYGGEEFILMSHTTHPDQLASYAQRLCDAVAGYRCQDTANEPITISIGVSTARIPQDDLLRIISEADEALYASKHLGKNRFTLYRNSSAEAVSPSPFISG